MDLEQLKNLAKQLPEHQPDEDRSQDLRNTLLAAVDKDDVRAPGRSPWLAVAAVAAAAALAFYAGRRVSPSSSSPQVAAQVAVAMPELTSPDGARFDRHTADIGGQLIEEVQLHTGSLHIQGTASPMPLRIATRHAQVQGVASFTIRASDDALQEVQVRAGRLEIRIDDQPAIVLGPGHSWARAESEHIELAVRDGETDADADTDADTDTDTNTDANTDTEIEVAREAEPGPTSDVAPTRSTRALRPNAHRAPDADNAQPIDVATEADAVPATEAVTETATAAPVASAAELAFDTGYRAVKRGDFGQALFDLELAISKTEQPALRADARYWRIIALARAGRALPAQKAMEEYLREHGATSRSGEVATMLGWVYLEQGKATLARPLFASGRKDASARVRASAQAGLEALSQ